DKCSYRKLVIKLAVDSGGDIETESIERSLRKWADFWGADSFRIVTIDDLSVRVQFLYGEDDFLVTTQYWIPEFARSESLPDKVLLCMDEEGNNVDFSIADSHTLIAGKTGSGKGSVIWSIIAPLAGRDDTLIYGVDLKGGMEFKM